MPEYSCYITVVNNLNVDLQFVSSNAAEGSWEANPDATITSGSTS